ncbi:response regulator [Microvirga sp. 3-52]|nr:response regulator [Microvirga sp. 3-52]
MFNPPVIAVVDDEEAIRDALSDLLLVMGYSCQTFDRAEAFLAAHTPDRFDCLITDIRMPGMSGLDLLQHLEAAGSTMPVIVVTSMTDSVTRSRALASGAHAYLTKPVTDEALLQSLTTALPGREIPGEDEEGPSGS